MVVTETAASAVVTLYDKIDITNSEELGRRLAELCAAGVKEITLDFSHVCHIDCSGLGKILFTQRKLREAQGGLRIINVHSAFLKRLFALIQLEKVLPLE